jgi:hypothetical protein
MVSGGTSTEVPLRHCVEDVVIHLSVLVHISMSACHVRAANHVPTLLFAHCQGLPMSGSANCCCQALNSLPVATVWPLMASPSLRALLKPFFRTGLL